MLVLGPCAFWRWATLVETCVYAQTVSANKSFAHSCGFVDFVQPQSDVDSG
ncbi:hypothetical protein RE6C_01437 [Rhodopirellula europaea 6C]|uniref:Uncharacterized protein n=1 Tax=Rhodopirellula europaea 6C TaxID=1263867 RepID=M2A834_9BACT|nr:hypothetical protein RE6C_01437 [Rhodopirellula europaea 6C]